jgi:hypothetical protein
MKGALLGYYAARSGNILPTFRDNLLGLPSTVKDVVLAVSLSAWFRNIMFSLIT